MASPAVLISMALSIKAMSRPQEANVEAMLMNTSTKLCGTDLGMRPKLSITLCEGTK